jgi:hypothetical protein
MAEQAAQARDDAGLLVLNEPSQLRLASLTNHVLGPIAGESQVSIGVVVHAHSTAREPTIFPPMHKDYSQTPLPQKLGIKEGSRVALQNAPPGFAGALGVEPRLRGELDVVVLFATRRGELTRAFAPLARRLTPAGGLWIAWPKKSADLESDLTFEIVQGIGLEAGLVDNKSCAIDETWQALRFVYRLEDRASSSKRSA